jgi:hypothetical protein
MCFDVPGLAEPIVRVLIVSPRNGKHEQVDAPDSGSSDDHGQNQHVEAKGAHGASQDGSGSGKAAAMLRCRRRFFRLNQAIGRSASLSRCTRRFHVRDTLRPWLHGRIPGYIIHVREQSELIGRFREVERASRMP